MLADHFQRESPHAFGGAFDVLCGRFAVGFHAPVGSLLYDRLRGDMPITFTLLSSITGSSVVANIGSTDSTRS